jgi:hypothetical protein
VAAHDLSALPRAQRRIPLVMHNVYKVTYSLSMERLLCIATGGFLLSFNKFGLSVRHSDYGIAIALHSWEMTNEAIVVWALRHGSLGNICKQGIRTFSLKRCVGV